MRLAFWKKKKAGGAPRSTRSREASYTPNLSANIAYVYTRQQAMQISTVYSCMTAIADSISRAPLLYKRLNEGRGYFVDNKAAPLYWLLRRMPNSRQTASTMMHDLVIQLLSCGNAYIVPVYGESGYADALVLVAEPTAVAYDVRANLYTIADAVHPEINIGRAYGGEEVLHFKINEQPSTGKGVGVLEYARRTLETAATAGAENLKRFANGGRVKAIFHQEDDGRVGFSSGVYDNNEMKQAGDGIEEQIQSGKDIITVPGAGKLDPLAMTSADMQFLESLKFSVAEICRFFRVPRSIVMDDTNSNYKSSEQATAQFYQFALAPIMRVIADEFNAKLIPDAVKDRYQFMFDVAALYAADPQTQAEYQAKMLGNGFTINEIRKMNNLPLLDGGDIAIVSANYKGLEDFKNEEV